MKRLLIACSLALVVLAVSSHSASAMVREYHVYATDGFVTMSDGTVKYSFGFNDTGVQGQIQFPSPLIWAHEGDEVRITLTNLGFRYRPDLADPHSVHLHGLHVVPYYDGVPETSFGVSMGGSFTYKFIAEREGTFMYHCHFEAVEHVQMGMYGPLVVYSRSGPGQIYGQRYLREYVWLVSEFDSRWHKSLEPDFVAPALPDFAQSDPPIPYDQWVRVNFRPDYWLINGMGFPDTLRTGSGLPIVTADPYGSAHVAGIQNGIFVANGTRAQFPANPDLGNTMPPTMSQSALVETETDQANLVRIIHMGFQTHPLHLHGTHFELIGQDASAKPHLQQGGKKVAEEVFTVLTGSGSTYDAFILYPTDLKCVSDGLVPKPEALPDGTELTDPSLWDTDPEGFWWYPMHCHDDYHAADAGIYPTGLFTMIKVKKPRCSNMGGGIGDGGQITLERSFELSE